MGIKSEMINYLNSSFRFVVFSCESGLPYLNVIHHREVCWLQQVDRGPEEGAGATAGGCKLQDTAHLGRSTTRVGCACCASAAAWTTCNILCDPANEFSLP